MNEKLTRILEQILSGLLILYFVVLLYKAIRELWHKPKKSIMEVKHGPEKETDEEAAAAEDEDG